VHGGGTLGPAAATQLPVTVKPEKLKGVAAEGDMFSKTVNGGSYMVWTAPADTQKFTHPMVTLQPKPLSLPEGRVHGGSLMAFLSGGAAGGSQSGGHAEAGTEKLGSLNVGMRHWV